MIDIVLVDDHPAVLAGLVRLVESEPGLACPGTATSAAGALDAVRETGAGVVVTDYELPDADGLMLCADLKSRAAAPGVIVYSAFARPRLLPAAAIAGADAMLDKGAPADDLFRVIREVARGEARLPDPPLEAMERCSAKVDPADMPLFGMAVNAVPLVDMAEVLGVDLTEARRRLRALLGRLRRDEQGTPSARDRQLSPG
jgi:DNA-binding NarL/FixJ family response regulator